MCTLLLLRRPGHAWPLLVAANRDEMADRPWRSPARHWPDRPEVAGGLDVLAGGTWLAANDHGVVAAVLNRINTLGPASGRRSRGDLPLQALRHRTAGDAVAALRRLDPLAYRAFNLLVADAREAFWVRSSDGSEAAVPAGIAVTAPAPGLSMLTAYDLNDLQSPRIRRYLPRFAAAPPPDPDVHDWRSWQHLLACRESDPGAGPGGAMTVVTTTGFGTVCSSLLALPTDVGDRLRWWFAPGRPGEAEFQRVAF